MSREVHGLGPCARCGHDPACGFASTYTTGAGERWYCHTDDHTCYAEAPLDAKEGCEVCDDGRGMPAELTDWTCPKCGMQWHQPTVAERAAFEGLVASFTRRDPNDTLERLLDKP